MQLPETELPPRQQENFILVLGFDEHRSTLEQGYDEEARTWVDFYADVIKQMRGQ